MVAHDHPSIVRLFYAFQDARFLYFVMEYLPGIFFIISLLWIDRSFIVGYLGGDLMNLLINREILSEAETRFYMGELIEAVEFVHSKGYIHRCFLALPCPCSSCLPCHCSSCFPLPILLLLKRASSSWFATVVT